MCGAVQPGVRCVLYDRLRSCECAGAVHDTEVTVRAQVPRGRQAGNGRGAVQSRSLPRPARYLPAHSTAAPRNRQRATCERVLLRQRATCGTHDATPGGIRRARLCAFSSLSTVEAAHHVAAQYSIFVVGHSGHTSLIPAYDHATTILQFIVAYCVTPRAHALVGVAKHKVPQHSRKAAHAQAAARRPTPSKLCAGPRPSPASLEAWGCIDRRGGLHG